MSISTVSQQFYVDIIDIDIDICLGYDWDYGRLLNVIPHFKTVLVYGGLHFHAHWQDNLFTEKYVAIFSFKSVNYAITCNYSANKLMVWIDKIAFT